MIITKFTIASVSGLLTLERLAAGLAREKFPALVSPATLEKYIGKHFNRKALLDEINSMSNQYLVVYVDDQAAGYARITSKGKRPDEIADQRAIRIADFGVLERYAGLSARESLLEKCLSVCMKYDAVWLNEFRENPMISFFRSNGFVSTQNESEECEEISLPSINLIRNQR
ncbi:MAG TPA: GNAT family N-acetyltransferase [Puia sp.]|jgi:hypothetical protein